MIVSDVKEGLESRGLEVVLSTDRHGVFDILLLMNGCRHACIEEEYSTTDQDVRMISVKGDMVDDIYSQEKDIPKHLIDKIMTQFVDKIL